MTGIFLMPDNFLLGLSLLSVSPFSAVAVRASWVWHLLKSSLCPCLQLLVDIRKVDCQVHNCLSHKSWPGGKTVHSEARAVRVFAHTACSPSCLHFNEGIKGDIIRTLYRKGKWGPKKSFNSSLCQLKNPHSETNTVWYQKPCYFLLYHPNSFTRMKAAFLDCSVLLKYSCYIKPHKRSSPGSLQKKLKKYLPNIGDAWKSFSLTERFSSVSSERVITYDLKCATIPEIIDNCCAEYKWKSLN